VKTIRSVAAMRDLCREARRSGKRIGFVPTMGFLHEGHLSLFRIARRESDLLAVSIFVNPAQFGPAEDLAGYPRDPERDGRLCEQEGVDLLFCPPVEEMYAGDSSVVVDEDPLSRGLCGASRPGHFRGVLTVVAKLLNIVQPDVAVFGQKDAQQARLVQRMVRDLSFPVRIEIGPIVREPDGLAMSSRNAYLSDQQRRRAACLHEALQLASRLYAEGERNAASIVSRMGDLVRAGDLPVRIDYMVAIDWETLEPVDRIEGKTLIALAVQVGPARLIDNILVGP